MFARYSSRSGSPEAWSANFLGRHPAQESASLLRLRTGLDPRWRAMAPYIRAGDRVLDVGCGLGAWALFLDGRGYDVVGVDYSSRLLVRASERAKASVQWASAGAEELPFAAGTFDCIISWGVIEHDPKGPARALREFLRVLKTGGRAVVTVPLDGQRQRRAEEIVNAGRPRDEFYEYHFTQHDLRHELEGAGFEAVSCRPVTRSIHIAMPRAYRWLSHRNALGRDIATQALKPVAALRKDSWHMLLGIGTRP